MEPFWWPIHLLKNHEKYEHAGSLLFALHVIVTKSRLSFIWGFWKVFKIWLYIWSHLVSKIWYKIMKNLRGAASLPALLCVLYQPSPALLNIRGGGCAPLTRQSAGFEKKWNIWLHANGAICFYTYLYLSLYRLLKKPKKTMHSENRFLKTFLG